ncbi:ABC transporter ATP-binding protein [Saccharomonospora azurea]|uniref:ATPase component of various ABC-type transport systems with duplicated ATPase domain n=1 Tax=Saccharomonospora azurea NA-128 TaxID=882081 RepID=H8G4C2_9PSEU|nr:ABC transporter ATP-binding protein [Saccharomonospora azurea]EHY87093.1 ATPase component of various ABC-type transport systems with duplicated ATPase domain [Saccharomonospora azurea NA-128]
MTRLATRDALVVDDLRIGTLAGDEVLKGVSYDIAPGEVLALVGESGSGKTTAGLAALGHVRRGLRHVAGTVLARPRDGEAVDLLALAEADRRRFRGTTVSYVPQDPALSLNPALCIGVQIREVLDIHGYGDSDAERAERVAEVLGEVGLPGDDDYQRRYPHQLSGGQQQRVGIAMAFACRPRVVVLDEPTTGLDVMTQTLVLQTVAQLTTQHDVAALYITHDLAVVSTVADRVAVMYEGEIVERGTADEVLRTPSHPYTRRLVAAVPHLGTASTEPSSPDEPDEPDEDAALSVSRLSVSYGDKAVLQGVDLRVQPGECLMLLGESGSGKTTLSRCVAGLNEHYDGTVSLAGTPLPVSTRKRTSEQLRAVQYVFQSPFSSLNPRRTIAQSVEVPLETLTDLDRTARRERVAETLERVRLSATLADRLPDQLSGGERQRAAIARALVTTPDVLLCDEVTSALDVSVQASIIELLCSLREELGTAMLFVTHNIALARHVADHIAVLRDGLIVESGTVEEVLGDPQHPYTRDLLAHTPRMTT